MANIIIGADIAPTKRNEKLFLVGDRLELIGRSLSDILERADYSVFNLETPLSDHLSPIEKEGMNLCAPTATINGIAALNPSLLALANNHIMDQGKSGFNSTIKTLEDYGIEHVGVGSKLSTVKTYKIANLGECIIGVYNCSEHEFSIVTRNTPGANPFDPLISFDEIANLHKMVDYTIVLFHGGVELYQYPSPNMQRICRKFVDVGADLVVCQHSHCIGCKEEYNRGTIVYGQGNFIFENSKNSLWDRSLLIRIDNKDISYIPIVHFNGRVRLAEGYTKEQILSEFEGRSKKIEYPGFIEEEFYRFSCNNIYKYLAGMRYRNSKFRRLLNRVTKKSYDRFISRFAFFDQNLVRIRNYIECESQREVLLAGLIFHKKGMNNKK